MAQTHALDAGSRPTAGRAEPAYSLASAPGQLVFAGELRLADGPSFWKALRARIRDAAPPRLDFDVGRLRFVDGAAAAMIAAARRDLEARGIACDLVGADTSVARIFALYEPVAPPEPAPAPGFVERFGREVADAFRGLAGAVSFLGEMAAETAAAVRRPRTANWREVLPLAERAGADAVPIVLAINFLVGVVMAYQSARSLQTYGASIYVADIVVLAMTRELAPLMTAIILAGRSGAAFTAEIGTMKVNEEIDALRTLGLGPVRHLALPRIAALMLVTPVLVLMADVVGSAGGMVVAAMQLDITPAAYIREARSILKPSDVWSGLVKSVVFAGAIALIACQRAFATRGGAAAVGAKTTSTVVTCLFALVLLDAVLTVLFKAVRA